MIVLAEDIFLRNVLFPLPVESNDTHKDKEDGMGGLPKDKETCGVTGVALEDDLAAVLSHISTLSIGNKHETNFGEGCLGGGQGVEDREEG